MMHWGLYHEHCHLLYRYITSSLLVYFCVPVLRLGFHPIFHLSSMTTPMHALTDGGLVAAGGRETRGQYGNKTGIIRVEETMKLYSVYMLLDIHCGDYHGGHTNSYNRFMTLEKSPITWLAIVINRSIIADQLQRHCNYCVCVRYHRIRCLYPFAWCDIDLLKFPGDFGDSNLFFWLCDVIS